MFLITRIKGALITTCLIISITLTGSLYAQQGSYAGNESKLDAGSLYSKAQAVSFGDNICAKIFEDEKNTYYAVDVKQISSRFEKIRMLELSYEDVSLVNIGGDVNTMYFYFLVNITLEKSSEDIINLIDNFSNLSKTELQSMNSEQLRLWLIQHDKYSKK